MQSQASPGRKQAQVLLELQKENLELMRSLQESQQSSEQNESLQRSTAEHSERLQRERTAIRKILDGKVLVLVHKLHAAILETGAEVSNLLPNPAWRRHPV